MQGSFTPFHLAAVARTLTPRSRLVLNGDGTVNHEQSEFLYTYQISMQVRRQRAPFYAFVHTVTLHRKMVQPGPELQLLKRRWVIQKPGQAAEVAARALQPPPMRGWLRYCVCLLVP